MYNPQNEEQSIFGMMPFQPQGNLPQLFDEEMARLQLPQGIASLALGTRSDMYRDGLMQVATALTYFAVQKQAFAALGMLPAMEPWLMQFTQQYLSDMVRITGISTEILIAEMRAFDPNERSQGAVAKFIRRILGMSR